MDGCQMLWEAPSVFCNTPYGEGRDRWVERSIAAAFNRKIVLLIPAHTETRIFQRARLACTSVLFAKARPRFGVLRENRRRAAASHGSAIFGLGVDLCSFASLGVVMESRASAASLEGHK